MFRRSDKGISTEEVLGAFERDLARQEDLIYGVALFFECLTVLHADQPAVVETYRKQFRNIIQKGREMIVHAGVLLAEARQEPRKIHLLKQFTFSLCREHPAPAELVARAGLLVDTYTKIFPDRDRAKEFTREETFRLMEAAGLGLDEKVAS